MPNPVNLEELEWQEWRHSDRIRLRFKTFEKEAFEDEDSAAHMGVCVQELPPGCCTDPAHYHMKEEEHTFVLKGAMDVRLGDETFHLTPGHYVRFAAADPREHCLTNNTDDPCEYLLWGERNPDDVVVYPDSNKVSVQALGEIYRRQPLDYWDGEKQ